ncbi:2573_t:CDS:1 [Ambispora gerdemannii]|uniref:2573_t:CDS:1 n=1 Tax=Ambispora gerdemannii TaxID=144530 RepID=A0A9N9AEZ1_9GLOM|nr:2573_t:CDS:1 [Ambispora gerdemannii]
MKIFTALTLLVAAISLTADAAPTSKSPVVSIELAKDDLPDYFTWLEKSKININRALLKYRKNIRKAFSEGLVGQDAIEKLEAASTPMFGDSSPKTFLIDVNYKKGKTNSTSDTGSKKSKGKKGKPINNPLQDEGMDIGYHGPIKIGGQTFNVIFDTGSSDIWVPAQECPDAACKSHKAFNPKKSKGFKTDNKPFDIQYGTGAVSGVIAVDDISIAGAKAKGQIFGLSTKMSDFFTNAKFDGILGMGLDKLSSQNAKTPFTQLVEQKAVKDPVFGFFLGRQKDGRGNKSQLTLGGVDSTKFTGQLKYNKLVGKNGYWEIALGDASVNGKPLGFSKKTAIIDTGTTLLIVPPADAAAIHKAIKGSVNQQGEYFVPCNTKAVVSLTFGGVTYKISPKDLARERTNQHNLCVSGIAGDNIGGPNQWLVGDTFLKNVYSAYDIKKLAVGFAPIK